MNNRPVCGRCGSPRAPDAPEGLCLRCLLDTAVEDDTWCESAGSAFDGVQSDPQPASAGKLPASVPPGAADLESSSPLLNWRFGDYGLLEEIGRGGMGVVYRAHQVSLDRFVALKVILFGPLASADQIRRFRTEASAAAALQHPNIVAVHEVGVHEGQHYLVMDLVDGPSLAGLVKDKPLPAKRAAAYLKSIAEAIHFAHERGILHRDLKPSNVLVGSDDRPRVADFGLARRMGTDSSLTVTGQMLGSPNYMPPEQAAGGGGKVGRPADVYGLGAILYHLLTARPPFQAETIPQTIQLVTGAEPLSPRALVPSVPRDLETICLKCLEKDPAKRYPTAQALAEELDRFLKGEPTHARPVGPTGKVWRWCRRKPAVATTLAVSLASLLVISVVSVASAVRTNRARAAERLEAYYSAIALADQYIQQGNIQGAKDLLFGCPAEFRHWEWGHLMFLCHQEALSIDTAAHAPAADTSSDKRLVALSFIPDGSALITQGADGSVKVWDTETGRMRFAVGGPAQPVHWYTVDPLGHRLAVAGRDGAIQVLEMANGREVLSVVHGTNVACCTALGPAGRQLVTGGGGVVCVWDVERKECLRRWEVGTVAFERFELNEDATRLATKQGRLTRVWEVNTGAELLSVVPPITNCLSYTMNGSVSAGVAFDTDNRAWLWRTNGTCVDLGLIRGSTWESHRWASFAANGQLFCTGGDQCTARVWDSLTARERFTLPGRITGAEFSPDSTRLLTRGEESVARIWDVGTAQEVRTLRGHYAIVERACFSPNGRLVATADQDGAVKLWSASNGREVLAGDSWPWGACYSADGERLACISSPLLDLRVWDSDSGAELLRFRPGMEHCCVHARFSPDGRFLATGGAGGDVRLWDSETGREVRRFYGHTEFVVPVAFSPSGKMLAAGAMDGTARLWDVESGNLLRVFQRPARGVTWVLFSPESSRLYVGSADGFVRAYDPQSGQLQIEIGESQPSAAMLTFSLTPDGRHLYTADWLNNTRRAWNTLTGRPLPGSHEPQRAGFLSAFTPDGHRMAVVFQDTRRGYGNSESTCVIMDVVSGRHVLALPRARDNVGSLLFSPSGRRLLNTDGSNFTTRQWETFPWREEEYLEEGRNQKAEGGGQRSKIRGQELDLTFLTRVRAYADRYWRERLRAEATAKPAPPREPMVRWDRSLWPKRDERSGPNQIDLIEHYTTRLDVPLYPSCIGSTADDDLRNLPCGTVVLSEVTFDIRGVTMLRCLMSRGYPFRWLWEQHPERIEGIEVPKTFRRLQVLHGMHHYDSMGVEDGATIGRYVLHYSDGTSAELPIVLGRHVRNWWAQEGEENPLAPLPEGTVAWTGSNPSAMDAKATLRLYLTSYENPHPEKKVVRVDFVSAMTTAAPFLVAMTVEP